METTQKLHPLFKAFLKPENRATLVYVVNHPAFYAYSTNSAVVKNILYAALSIDLKELAEYLDIYADDIANVEYVLREFRVALKDTTNIKVQEIVRSSETANRLRTIKAVETISSNELCRRVTKTIAGLKVDDAETNVQLSILSNINRQEYITNSNFKEMIARKYSTRALSAATTRENFINFIKQAMPLTYKTSPAVVELVVNSIFSN